MKRSGIDVTWVWTVLFLGIIITAGCSSDNLGVCTGQMLPKPTVEQWTINAPFDQVWAAVKNDAENNSDKILVSSEKDGIISYCQPAENWRDLEQGSVMPKSLVGGVDPDFFYREAQKTGKGLAVTTLWVENNGTKCNLHIERVYYGPLSYPGVGHSLGEYELATYNRIKKALQ